MVLIKKVNRFYLIKSINLLSYKISKIKALLFINKTLLNFKMTSNKKGYLRINVGPARPRQRYPRTEDQPKVTATVLSCFIGECESHPMMQKHINRFHCLHSQ